MCLKNSTRTCLKNSVWILCNIHSTMDISSLSLIFSIYKNYLIKLIINTCDLTAKSPAGRLEAFNIFHKISLDLIAVQSHKRYAASISLSTYLSPGQEVRRHDQRPSPPSGPGHKGAIGVGRRDPLQEIGLTPTPK